MKITLEQKIAIYKAMDVLVDIEKAAWEDMKAKGMDFECREAELHENADAAWWKLKELWKFF